MFSPLDALMAKFWWAVYVLCVYRRMAASEERAPKLFPHSFQQRWLLLVLTVVMVRIWASGQVYILWDKEPGADYIKSAGAHEMFVALATFGS